MAGIREKLDKQFAWQLTRHATSGSQLDLLVVLDEVTDYLTAQMRADRDRVREGVRGELERRAEAGEIRRWLEVYGPSARPDRVNHYLLIADGGGIE